MPPLNSLLIPHSSLSDHKDSCNILIKLNPDVIHALKKTLLENDSMKPKLIVKNGDYYIKLNQELIKTKKFNEPSRIDIYTNDHEVCLNRGKIDMRLNMLHKDKSRLKRIQSIERPRSEVNSTGTSFTQANSKSVPTSPYLGLVNFKEGDEFAKLRKLIHLLSLGPITAREINGIVKVDTKIITKFGEVYVPNEEDVKYSHYSDSQDTKYVLRDVFYKDLSLYFFTDSERFTILQSIDSKLTKLGYDSENSIKLNVNHEYDEILQKLQLLKQKKLQEAKKKQDELEELKRQEELKELQRKEEKKLEESVPLSSGNKKETKTKKTTPPPPPASNSSKSKVMSRKRTISESSNSSVNSMKLSDEVESPITSQEEIDDDISLNEIKRQRVIKLSNEQIDLFKKFKRKYQIYSNLHHSLSTSKVRSRTEFQKLMALENEVKILKRKLSKLEDK